MGKKSGTIYLLEDNTKAIAYNNEQEAEFIKAGKVFIHHLGSDMKPLKGPDGKKVSGLKSKDKLTQIGFTD